MAFEEVNIYKLIEAQIGSLVICVSQEIENKTFRLACLSEEEAVKVKN